MGAGCQQGGAPVQDGDLSAPGEDVEGVQVAVADDLGCWRRPMIDQPTPAAHELFPAPIARRNAQEAQHAPRVHGPRSTTRSTTSKPHPANITPGDGIQVTLSERRTVTHGRAREPAGQDARRPFRTRSYGDLRAAARRLSGASPAGRTLILGGWSLIAPVCKPGHHPGAAAAA